MSAALQEEPIAYSLSVDELAEQNVDAIAQERFDVFAPPTESASEHWAKVRQLAAQCVVRVTHALDAVVVGPSVYLSGSEKAFRNKERAAVGLKPKR